MQTELTPEASARPFVALGRQSLKRRRRRLVSVRRTYRIDEYTSWRGCAYLEKCSATVRYTSRRNGTTRSATVPFAVLRSGEIRTETLKIVTSSGQPRLDASALKTIRACIPFDPPPKEMTVVVAVDFGRKR